MRASDIHFRIDSSYFQVSFRIDGIKRPMKMFGDSTENGRLLVNTLFNSMCTEQSTPTLSATESSDARLKEEFVSMLGLSTGRFASRPGNSDTLVAVVRLVSKRKQQLELEDLGLTLSKPRRSDERYLNLQVRFFPVGRLVTANQRFHSVWQSLLHEMIQV
jgi:hypothetical protein